MSGKYTDAQKKASLKYQSGMAQIKITVTKEKRDLYKQLADDKNMSLTSLIVKLLEDLL